jgi:high-affinity nickel permease
MKAPLFFLAALVAFLVLPVDFTTSLSVLFAAGLGAIMISEYRWANRRPLARQACVAALSVEPLRLAA